MRLRNPLEALDLVDRRVALLGSAVILLTFLAAAVALSALDEFLAGRRVAGALAAFHEGRLADARALAAAAIRAKSDYAAPRLLEIAIRARQGELASGQEMEEAYRTVAVEAPPGRSASLWVRSGWEAATLATERLPPDLESRMRETARSWPEEAEPAVNLARLAARKGGWGDVEGYLRKALSERQLSPPSADATVAGYLLLAERYERQGDLAEARECLARALWVSGRDRAGATGLDLLLARVELLARLDPWRLSPEDLTAAERLLSRRSATHVQRSAATLAQVRLANLLAVAASLAPNAEALPREFETRLSVLLAEGWDDLPAGSTDIVVELNRAARKLSSSHKSSSQIYRSTPEVRPTGVPRDVWRAVEQNRIVLEVLAGGADGKGGREGSTERALTRLEAFLGDGPEEATPLANAAVLSDRLGLSTKAAAFYRRSLALRPDQPAVARRLAALER